MEKKQLLPSLDRSIDEIRRISGGSSDVLINRFVTGGIHCALLCCEGMVSTSVITELIFEPITDIPQQKDSHGLFHYINEELLLSTDRPQVEDYPTLFRLVNSGFAVLIAEGMTTGLAFGVQGYNTRGVQEPSGEGNIMGAHEGFTETIRTNMSQIRRRMKTPELVMELFIKGEKSSTDLCLCYMKDRVPKALTEKIRRSLEGIELEAILTTGYIRPFVENGSFELFSSTGTTERPDVLCSKLIEGRAAILVDGVPYAIIIPRLFCESFQTLDDYAYKPYYATFIRWLKYAAFLTAVLLPAFYAAIVMYHPELLNSTLFMLLVEAEKKAPLSIVTESLFALLMYEMIREAGVRLPKPTGGSCQHNQRTHYRRRGSKLGTGEHAAADHDSAGCTGRTGSSRAGAPDNGAAPCLPDSRGSAGTFRHKPPCLRGAGEHLRHRGLRLSLHSAHIAVQGQGHGGHGSPQRHKEAPEPRLHRGGIS